MSLPDYRVLEHTADFAFEVSAPDWSGLLASATAALADVIRREADDAPGADERRVEVRGADREDVLVAWLGELLYLYERDGFLARRARLDSATTTGAAGVLVGRVEDVRAEPPDRVVKAVTYHDLRVEEGGPGRPWRAAIVLDL